MSCGPPPRGPRSRRPGRAQYYYVPYRYYNLLLLVVLVLSLFASLSFIIRGNLSELRAVTPGRGSVRLRTDGVRTNGAAAKVMNFERWGKRGTPWHFWEDKSSLTGVPKKSLFQKHFNKNTVSPSVLTPFVPFRARHHVQDLR